MLIKSYLCPDIHCENCAEKVKAALADLPVEGVDIVVDQSTVRVGLLDEHDDEMVKTCLTEAGFPPKEVLAP